MNAPVLSGGERFVGHLNEFRDDPLGMLRRFNQECGDAGYLSLPGIKLLIVNTPKLAGELLVDHASSFRKSRIIRAALFPLVGNGLFSSEGAVWRRQRKLMAPLFQPAFIPEYAAAMSNVAERHVQRWTEGAEIDVAREMTHITMGIAGKTLFGAELSESDDLGDALTVLLEWAARNAGSVPQVAKLEVLGLLERRFPRLVEALEPPLLLPPRCRRAVRVLDRQVAKMIADRRSNPTGHDDLLSRLLEARDETGPMADRQLRDEILTLFVAGHETTATGLSWSLYLLARNPEHLAAVEHEALTAKGLDLPLATQAFSEALRLYPPIPLYEREALEPVQVGDQALPRGAYVAVFPWALQHRPEVWPDPERFDPSRFTPAAAEGRSRYAWLPFGAGPRVCLGLHFAMLEGALALAAILRRARLELVDPAAEAVPDPRAATLRPLGGIAMRVRLRTTQQPLSHVG